MVCDLKGVAHLVFLVPQCFSCQTVHTSEDTILTCLNNLTGKLTPKSISVDSHQQRLQNLSCVPCGCSNHIVLLLFLPNCNSKGNQVFSPCSTQNDFLCPFVGTSILHGLQCPCSGVMCERANPQKERFVLHSSDTRSISCKGLNRQKFNIMLQRTMEQDLQDFFHPLASTIHVVHCIVICKKRSKQRTIESVVEPSCFLQHAVGG